MSAPCVVNCDLCKMGSIVPKSLYGVKCATKNCLGIVFRPIDDDKKYVRTICKDKPNYYYVEADTKCLQCGCCDAVFTITDNLIEIKNGQNIYNTKKLPTKGEPKADLATTLARCEDKLRSTEAVLVKLKSEKDSLQELLQKAQETIESEVAKAKCVEREMEILKTDNCFFHKRMEELKTELKDFAELNEEFVQLKKENNKLESKNQEENAKNDEMMKQLMKATHERDLLMNSQNTNKELAEQVKTLMTTNLNLSATMARMTALTMETTEVEEKIEDSEEQLTEQLEDEQCSVPCGFCGVKANVPDSSCGVAYCKNCPPNSAIILAPIKDGYRYIRWQCKHTVFYYRAPNEQKSFFCSCCSRIYKITDAAIEVRNGQRVYKAIAEFLAEDEVVELKKKLKEMEKQHESEMKAAEDNVKKVIEEIDEAGKDYQEQMKKMASLKEQNRKTAEELDNLLKNNTENENIKKDEIDAMKKKMAHLMEINTMLMKKMMDKNVDARNVTF